VKTIPLTQGQVALVDDADYEYLNRFKWYANKICRTYYAVRNVRRGKILMHRAILDAPDGLEVDHINGDGLDNRRLNIRLCSHSENDRSQRLHHRNKTGFKGVFFYKNNSKNPYGVQIALNRKTIRLGYYPTAKAAARAYDAAALKHHGEFALTNEMLGLL